MEQIEQVLTQFMSADKSRLQAEEYLNNLKKEDSSKAMDLLLNGLQLQKQDLSELSAVLLKKYFLEKVEDMQSIGQQKLMEMVQIMKTIIQTSRLAMQKRLCENLVCIYEQQQQHQQLLEMAYEYHQQNMKFVSLYIIELFCEYSFDEDILKQFQIQIMKMFEMSLEDEDIKIRVQGLVCISTFLSFVQDQALVTKFQNILPLALKIAVEAIQKDEDQGQKVLESMCLIIEMHPKLIKSQFDQFANLFLEVIQNKFGDGLRKAALNNLLEMATHLGPQMRKSEIISQRMFGIIFQILQESDEEMEEWLEEIEDNLQSRQDLQGFCQDIVAKMTTELGCKFMLKNSISIIKQLLQSNCDKQIYAGLVGLAYMLDNAQQHYKEDLDSFMSLIKPHLENQNLNIKLRYGLLTLLAMLCTEFNPIVQNKYDQIMIGFIVQNMGNKELKIQHRSTQCLVNFVRDLVENEDNQVDFKKYSDQVLGNLKVLFQSSVQNNQLKMLEEVLSCLGVYSLAIENDFSQYYQHFMPDLKQLVQQFPSETGQQVNIRVLAIECLGYLLKSVKDNKTIFINDVDHIMNSLIQFHQSIQSDDDQHLSAITNVYSNMADTLKREFNKYLDQIYPSVIKSGSIAIDFHVEDVLVNANQDKESNDKILSANIDLKGLGGQKRLALNAAALELKMSSLDCVISICKSTKDILNRNDYIGQTFTMAQNILENNKISREVTHKGLEIMSLLIECVPVQQQQQIIQNNYNVFIKLLKQEVEFQREHEIDIIMSFLSDMLKNYKKVDPTLLSHQQIQQTIELMKQCLEYSQKGKKRVLKKYTEDNQLDELDEEEYDKFEQKYEVYNDLYSCNMDLGGQLLRILQQNVEPIYLQQICPFYSEIISRVNTNSTDNEVLYAVYLIDEIIEYSSKETIEQMGKQMLDQLINIFRTKNNQDIRQSVVYGYGLLAGRQCLDNSILETILQHMDTVYQDYSTDSDYETKETTVVAMFRVSLNQELNEQMHHKIAELLINCLPLRSEGEETMIANNMFLRQVRDGKQYYKERVDKVQQIHQAVQNLESQSKENEMVDQEGMEIIRVILKL